MNTLDIIILCLVLIPGLVLGIKKGFIYQIVTLIALVAGVWLSFSFAEPLGGWVFKHFPSVSQGIWNVAAFTVIFLAVYMVISLIGKLIRKISADLVGGWVDRVFGIVFSTLKLACLVGVFVLIFDGLNGKFSLVSEAELHESVLYDYLLGFSKFIFPYLKSLVTNG